MRDWLILDTRPPLLLWRRAFTIGDAVKAVDDALTFGNKLIDLAAKELACAVRRNARRLRQVSIRAQRFAVRTLVRSIDAVLPEPKPLPEEKVVWEGVDNHNALVAHAVHFNLFGSKVFWAASVAVALMFNALFYGV